MTEPRTSNAIPLLAIFAPLFLVLLLQVGAAVWFSSGVNRVQEEQERRLTSLEVEQKDLHKALEVIGVSIARVDERVGVLIDRAQRTERSR